jgi:outer membrane protein assembly factor BamB
MIRDGRVVFTAPDGEAVHCLNLRDGTLAWKERRVNDLYLAGVFRGKVLLVGRDLCRALSLQDGSEIWKVETGMPSGRGVANANTYYLPLKSAEVWAIDIDTGKVQSKSRSPQGEVPGNLIFHEGDVISQTINSLTVYPQLAVRERSISESLAKDPNNPKGLLDRGELRLHQGSLIQAVEDLRASLKNQLPEELRPRARTKLYEALGDLLEADFAANEALLKEYEDLSVIAAPPNEAEADRAVREREQRDRQARMLRLVAKGREGQGRLKEAFQAYMEFANLGKEELIALPEDPGTKALPKVWAQGRIEAMIRKAAPKQRESLEKALEAQWLQAEATGALESMRQFVSLFGSVSAQGRRARLTVAERLLQAEKLTEAEGELLILMRDAESDVAAPALEALARLKTRLGELDDAARCYRILAQKYPKTIIRDGKTGEELYLELMTDKRFLPYVEELRRGWMGSHTIEPRPGTPTLQDGGMAAQLFWLEPEGSEAAQFFRRYRIGIDNNNRQVRRVDRTTGEDRQLFQLSGLMPTIYNNPSMQYRFRPTCYVRGQVLVFTWGHYVYAYDLRQRDNKPLWTYDLLGGMTDPGNRRPGEPSVQLMVNVNGSLDLLIANSSAGRVGTIGAVESHCVCFLVRDEGLVAVDPLRVDKVQGPTPGTTIERPRRIWVKADVPPNSEMFSDGEHLYVLPIAASNQPPGRAFALRTADGTRITLPDFASLWSKKQRILGRKLLIKDVDPKGGLALRLYDVHTGHDVWSKTFPPQSLVLQSLPPSLAGVLDGTGQLQVFHAETGKDVLSAQLSVPPPGGTEGCLLQDDSQIYVTLNSRDPNVRRDVYPPGLSLRSVPVNGNVYAFDQQSGKKVWEQNVPHQVLLTDQFEDLPILLFGCYQTQWIPMPGNQVAPQQGSAVLALDKRNGEKIDDLTQQRGNLQLHTLKVDPRTGQVEVVGYQFRRSYVVNY